MNIKTMVKYSLQYFPFKARAEPLRLAFVAGGIPFTNVATSFDEFKAIKPTLPSGQLPLLTVEDGNQKDHYSQSMAMLRFIGKLSTNNLYPQDPKQAMAVDEILDLISDASRPIEISVQGAPAFFIQDSAWSKDEVMGIRTRMLAKDKNGSIPYFLSILEKKLKENGSGWIVGDSLTIADLAMTRYEDWLSSGILDGIPATVLDDYPLVKAHFQKVLNLPSIKAFHEAHQTPYTTFDYVPPN